MSSGNVGKTLIRSFLATMLVTLGVTSYLRASPQGSTDPCRCTYEWGPTEIVGSVPTVCHLSGQVDVLATLTTGLTQHGQCALGTCTPRNCKASGTISVSAQSTCLIKIGKDGTPLARGSTDVTAYIRDDLECGDFADYTVSIGDVPIVRVTNVCWTCGSGH